MYDCEWCNKRPKWCHHLNNCNIFVIRNNLMLKTIFNEHCRLGLWSWFCVHAQGLNSIPPKGFSFSLHYWFIFEWCLCLWFHSSAESRGRLYSETPLGKQNQPSNKKEPTLWQNNLFTQSMWHLLSFQSISQTFSCVHSGRLTLKCQ